MRRNLSYYYLLVPRIHIFVLRAHLVRGESHNQRNTTGELATISPCCRALVSKRLSIKKISTPTFHSSYSKSSIQQYLCFIHGHKSFNQCRTTMQPWQQKCSNDCGPLQTRLTAKHYKSSELGSDCNKRFVHIFLTKEGMDTLVGAIDHPHRLTVVGCGQTFGQIQQQRVFVLECQSYVFS